MKLFFWAFLPDKKWSLFERKSVGGSFVVERPVDYLVIRERGVPVPPWCCFPHLLCSQCITNQLSWRKMLACAHVLQTAMEPDFPVTLFRILLSFPISHVDSGRKRRGKPVRLSLHFPGKHLRVLHLIWTQRWQDVVCHHQELRWRPQMGLLSRSRCEATKQTHTDRSCHSMFFFSNFPHFTEENVNLHCLH